MHCTRSGQGTGECRPLVREKRDMNIRRQFASTNLLLITLGAIPDGCAEALKVHATAPPGRTPSLEALAKWGPDAPLKIGQQAPPLGLS